MTINTEARSEIIRVRVTPTQKQKFERVSNGMGLCAATHAFLLLLDAAGEAAPTHAHRKPRQGGGTETNHRPLKPAPGRQCPGARGQYGGATINRLRV